MYEKKENENNILARELDGSFTNEIPYNYAHKYEIYKEVKYDMV